MTTESGAHDRRHGATLTSRLHLVRVAGQRRDPKCLRHATRNALKRPLKTLTLTSELPTAAGQVRVLLNADRRAGHQQPALTGIVDREDGSRSGARRYAAPPY
jgi:hypothetical protein